MEVRIGNGMEEIRTRVEAVVRGQTAARDSVDAKVLAEKLPVLQSRPASSPD